MPGMEVGANGQISFNGKAINRFYIEGMDLMNDRYALASNNIAKQRVKAVEVLQNHQPIELLRGKTFSEQAAINLVLEDDSKATLVGSADIGLGGSEDDFLYSNRLLAMLFGSKHQNLSIYKNDNTGNDLFREINPITLADFEKENTMEEGLITAVSTTAPDIDPSRYTFNKSHLAATNHLAKLAEKTTLRTQISFFNDIAKQSNVVETDYLFADTLPARFETNALHAKKQRLDASFDYEKNRPDLYVKNELEGTMDWQSANSHTVWNTMDRRLTSTPDRKYLSDALDVKLPLKSDRHISITSVNSYNEMPQQLSLYSDALQRLDYTAFRTHTSAAFRHRLFGLYANYRAGFKGLFQSLASNIGGASSIPKQHYKQYMPYGALGLQYSNHTLRMEADAKLHLLHWRQGSDCATSASPEGRFFLKYTLSATSALSLTYRYAEQLHDLRQTYDGPLFTSYRTLLDNSQPPRVEGRHNLALRWQYTQPIKGLFLSLTASAGRTRRHSAFRTELLPDGEVLLRSRIAANYNADTYLLNARFSKSFGFWKSLLALSGNYVKNRDAQFLDESLQDFDLDNASARLTYSARPLRLLSFELESAWQQTHMKSPLTTSDVNTLKHRLNLTFPLTDHLQLGLDNTLLQSLEAKESSWFADFLASYTHKRMEFQFRVNNLLGRSLYERDYVSSIEQTYCRYTLRPREFLAKAAFTF